MSEDETREIGTIDTSKYEGHTEGPWRSYLMADGGEVWYEIKCKSEPLGFISVHNENHANSLLVADAPLLLEEVKRLREILHIAEQNIPRRIHWDCYIEALIEAGFEKGEEEE